MGLSRVPREYPLNIEQLADLLKDDAIVLIDVRSACDFVQGHIPGSWSVELQDIANGLSESLRGRLFGPKSPRVMIVGSEESREAVRLLGEVGVPADEIENGVQAWRAFGLPLNRGVSA